MPEISIVVPVYNIQEYIRECIESILAQSFRDFELILVDDGSKDLSGKICDEYLDKDNRIKVIHKENGGLSDARNVGMDGAKGNYLTFIDGDDAVSPLYLEILYTTLKEQNADLVQGSFTRKKESLVLRSDIKKIICLENKEAIHDYLHRKGLYVSACAKIYRRELFEHINFPVGKLNEDNFTTYKIIAKSARCVVIDQPIYWHRINKNSITRSSFRRQKLEILQVPEEMRIFLRDKDTESLQQDIDYYEFRLKLSVYNRLLAQTSAKEYQKEKNELRTAILNFKETDGNKKIKMVTLGINYAFPLYRFLVKLAFSQGIIA